MQNRLIRIGESVAWLGTSRAMVRFALLFCFLTTTTGVSLSSFIATQEGGPQLGCCCGTGPKKSSCCCAKAQTSASKSSCCAGKKNKATTSCCASKSVKQTKTNSQCDAKSYLNSGCEPQLVGACSCGSGTPEGIVVQTDPRMPSEYTYYLPSQHVTTMWLSDELLIDSHLTIDPPPPKS